MQTKPPSDVRRTQLVNSALDLAERVGIGSVTMRAVADQAGVSPGVIHYIFESKEALVTAMGEEMILGVTDTLHRAYESAAGDRRLSGVRGLRELVHSGLSAVWPIMEKTADRQLLAYELKTYLLRHRALGSAAAADIAAGQYRIRDKETRQFLERCAEHSGTMWIEPIDSITRFGMAVVDGLILRWLVDRDEMSVLAQLDDVSGMIASKAVEV